MRHERIPKKVAEDLDAKAVYGDPSGVKGLKFWVPKNGIGVNSDEISNKDLEKKAGAKAMKALDTTRFAERGRRVELVQQFTGTHNGACYQVREEGDIGRESNKRGIRRLFAAIHIHQITNQDKVGKRNGQRQKDIKLDMAGGQMQKPQQGLATLR